jgi:hypothetical protein
VQLRVRALQRFVLADRDISAWKFWTLVDLADSMT